MNREGTTDPLFVKRKTMSRTATGPLRRKNSETLASNEGLAEELNSFFSSIFTREDGTNVPRAEDRGAAEKRGVRFRQAKGENEDKEAKSGCSSWPRWD
jgi:hypothetical protein